MENKRRTRGISGLVRQILLEKEIVKPVSHKNEDDIFWQEGGDPADYRQRGSRKGPLEDHRSPEGKGPSRYGWEFILKTEKSGMIQKTDPSKVSDKRGEEGGKKTFF